jgi:hypothetical protein
MSSVSNRPIWTVTSYFQAWPWRRAAVPVAEQRVFLAQMAAHGASPMVNLSGGGPAAHEDKRGFAPIQELYSFMADNPTLFDHDRSAATIALLYDQSTLVYFGNDDAHHRYIDEFRGFEQALDYDHIPFDIISTRTLNPQTLQRYRVLILPSMACISDTAAATLSAFVKEGGTLLCSFLSGRFDSQANPREQGALDELLGIKDVAPPVATVGEVSETSQVYMRRQGSHPVNVRLMDVELLPLSGEYCAAQLSPDTTVPWRRTTPFRLFPEGWSYTTEPDEGQPLQVIRTHPGGGKTVWFASSVGRSFYLLRNPDVGHLIADTLRWAAGESVTLRVEAPNTLQVSLRTLADGRSAVHCVNLTGGERFFEHTIPLHNIRIALKSDRPITSVHSAASGQELALHHVNGWYEVSLPHIDVYDIVLFSHIH